jgi:GT2 family glycosyltransferase
VISISGHGSDARLSTTWRPDVQAIAAPSVSIIIPTYNRPGLMASCYRALRETLPPSVDAEVIIVDDGSTDGFDDLERLVQDDPRAVLLRNDVNAGFVTSVNRGAGAATGDFLVFLNNDTIPLPGWLRPLLRTFRDRPDAGVVGGKLVYPDGRLQEAGAIVFSDGSAANFGSGDPDPDAPEYSYLREVDYVSGALFVTRRSLFRDLGGFDRIYGFGYCEDSDYCFKVRAHGLRAYYQPESAIVHMEGGTSGTDVTQGPKRFQVINRETFVARWRSDLARQPSPPGQESARAA